MSSLKRPDYNKLEKKQAQKDGATLVKNSGRGWEKGDAKLEGFLVDYKFNAKSFQLTLENWRKHKNDSWSNGQRDPLIVVCFEDGTKIGLVDYAWIEELIEHRKVWGI